MTTITTEGIQSYFLDTRDAAVETLGKRWVVATATAGSHTWVLPTVMACVLLVYVLPCLLWTFFASCLRGSMRACRRALFFCVCWLRRRPRRSSRAQAQAQRVLAADDSED